MNKPLTRGYLHLFLYFINLPASIIFLFPYCKNIWQVISIFFFTFSNLLQYGFSSIQHANYMSRKSYKTVKTLVNLSILFSNFVHIFTIYVFTNIYWPLVFSTILFPKLVLDTNKNSENFNYCLAIHYLYLVPIITFLIHSNNYFFLLYYLIKYLGDAVYLSQKPRKYYYDICHFLSLFEYSLSFFYLRKMLV